jgi:hypothetical protein
MPLTLLQSPLRCTMLIEVAAMVADALAGDAIADLAMPDLKA